jgi:M6 family metalloprotease-like protein
MNRAFFIFFFFLSLACGLFAQKKQEHSYFGNVHTPAGNLHVLVVFVRYEDQSLMNKDEVWPDVTAEGDANLPQMGRGGKNNSLFCADTQEIGKAANPHNISEMYSISSGGKFKITGDIFPVQVPVRWVSKEDFFGRQSKMNQAAINWIAQNYPNFDWSKYDKRKNTPNYKSDNQAFRPDSIIDYIIFLHRAWGGTGMGAVGNFKIPNTPYKVQDGFTGIECSSDAPHQWEYFKHEFAHNLFDAPHYAGANKACGDKLYTQKGWGLMAETHAPFTFANAWEQWWLGWLEPQTITKSGTYKIKDLCTGRDAVRIQVPGTEDFFWLENHQKKQFFDDKMFFKSDTTWGEPNSAKGLYAYVVAKPGADRERPRLNSFSVADANMIKFYNGTGFYDYLPRGDTAKMQYHPVAVWLRAKSNPIAGMSDFQFIRWDNNKDGKIEMAAAHGNMGPRTGEICEIWSVQGLSSPAKCTYNLTGDWEDAFQVGREFGLSGIMPILNYPIYDYQNEKLAPYLLNGITVKVLSQDAEGNFEIYVDFNDYEVRNDVRWCGNIQMPIRPQNQVLYWKIKEGVKLDFDLSETIDRSTKSLKTGNFTNPSSWVVEANNAIIIEKGANVTLQRFSKMELLGNAQIIIEKGGTLSLAATSELIVNEGTAITIKKGGKLLVGNDAYFRKMVGCKIQLEKGGKIKMLKK